MARCKLYQQGPDNRSTYGECWGFLSTSPGRLVAEADTLAGLTEAAANMGHENWAVQIGSRWIRPEEFFANRNVRKATANQ